jgi:hypothetical protein
MGESSLGNGHLVLYARKMRRAFHLFDVLFDLCADGRLLRNRGSCGQEL